MASFTDTARDPELARCFVELGDPVVGYSPSFKLRLTILGASLLAFVLGWAVAERVLNLGVILMVIGVVGACYSLPVLWAELRSMPYWICRGGIVALPWRRIEGFPWRDITALVFVQTTQTLEGWSLAGSGTLSATVTRQDGRKFVLKWLSPDVISFVQAQVFREMAPRVLDEIERGLPVRFGEVEMSREGLGHRRRPMLWEEIEDIKFDGRVVVRRRDGTRDYFFDVPNLGLFLALAETRCTTGRFERPAESGS